MTVSECEAQVLRLLDEVGVTDYNQRMYKLIDEAQRVIACTWGFIRRKAVLTDGENVLPEDCYAIETIYTSSDRTAAVHWDLGPVEVDGDWKRGIVLSGNGDGRYTLIYKAYPNEIGDNDSAKQIQLAPEYLAPLCTYVAALTQDNEYDKRAYQLFMERYNNEIALIERARSTTGKARVVTNGWSI